MNPLSFHYTPWHRHTQYLDAFSNVQPQIALLLDASQNDYLEVRKRVPGCRIIMRSYDWSDGGLDVLNRAQADPIGTGRWMANNWIDRMREWGSTCDPSLTYFTGTNEYSVIPGMQIPPFVTCEAEFARTLAAAGWRPCIGNEGVGHPSGVNAQGMVDWSMYAEWESVLQQTQGILGLHEYWRAENGPRMNVKPEDEARGLFWYAWRFMQCPFDVPIAITEWGVDQKVDAPGGTPSHGWQGLLEPNAYAYQLEDYCLKAISDPRFLGATIFTHDYASDEWATYDTDRGLNEIVNMAVELPGVGWYEPGTVPTPIPPEPPTPTPQPPQTGTLVHPLPKGQYAITQRFNETGLNAEGHEGTDFGATALTPVHAMADGVVVYAAWDANYGWYVRVWHAALGVHSFYAHLNSIQSAMGESVQAGQVIGTVGSTGNSTGPHLHYEIRVGDEEGYSAAAPKANGRIDPESYCALFGLSLATGDTVGGVQTVYMPLVSSV